MSYGIKYTSQFDSFKPLQSYQVDIYQKGYTGAVSELLLSANPVIQEWQEDDPYTPIRGCTLNVSIITNSTGVRLTNFYSEDDSYFYVEFKCINTDQFLFKGYLLQDDCSEIQLDFNHEIKLTFTDGLGILKDITLDRAAVITTVPTTESGLIAQKVSPVFFGNSFSSFDSRISVLKPGDAFQLVNGTTTYNFVCLGITYVLSAGWIVLCDRPITFSYSPTTFDFVYTIPYPLVGYISLIDVLKLCLKSTLLEIPFNSFITIFPVGGTVESTWDDTFVDASTFRVDTNSWMTCYDILDQIMTRFNCSLFQSNATWTLVRWDELYRYTTGTGATIRGNYYDESFTRIGYTANTSDFIFMNGSDMETGVIKSIVRPYKYVKETFNYIQPDNLLCNSNAKDLGPLIQQYDSGLYTIKEYVLNSWFDGPYSPIPDRFIRITYDNDPTSRTYKQELDRNIIVVNATGDSARSIKSCDIPLSKGDSIEFDFSFRTSVSQAGPINNVFVVSITDGTTTYFIHNNGSWATTLGFTYSTPAGANTLDWQSVNIISNPAPIDGIVNVYLAEATPNGGTPSADETLYKDLTFNITYLINNSGKIIGHTHTDSQSLEIKNNSSEDIYLDNSPRQSIKGSLYIASYTNLLRDITNDWGYPAFVVLPPIDVFTYDNLGQATTQEYLFTRYRPRAKYEGSYLKVLQGNGPYKFVTPLSIFVNSITPNSFRFVVGKLTIDYKNANCDLSLYELLNGAETEFVDGIIPQYRIWKGNRLYEFNYLYEN
jgi:hypothetical protein